MAKPSDRSPERKLQVVFVGAARGGVRDGGCPAVRGWLSRRRTTGRGRSWRRAAMAWPRVMGRRSSREAELEAENEELKAALGEAHVQLRVWKKGAEYLPPSRTSR